MDTVRVLDHLLTGLGCLAMADESLEGWELV